MEVILTILALSAVGIEWGLLGWYWWTYIYKDKNK